MVRSGEHLPRAFFIYMVYPWHVGCIPVLCRKRVYLVRCPWLARTCFAFPENFWGIYGAFPGNQSPI